MSLNFPLELIRASSGGDGPLSPTSLYDSDNNVLVSLGGDIPANWNDYDTPYNADRVEIGTSCTSIGSMAFYFCTGFTGSLVIPDSVTFIGDNSFLFSSFNGSLTIGNGVTTIDQNAFFGSEFTGSLTIGNSITTIEGAAFAGCSSITSVSILATTAPTINGGVFAGMGGVSPAVIHVPVGATGYAASYDGLTVVYDL